MLNQLENNISDVDNTDMLFGARMKTVDEVTSKAAALKVAQAVKQEFIDTIKPSKKEIEIVSAQLDGKQNGLYPCYDSIVTYYKIMISNRRKEIQAQMKFNICYVLYPESILYQRILSGERVTESMFVKQGEMHWQSLIMGTNRILDKHVTIGEDNSLTIDNHAWHIEKCVAPDCYVVSHPEAGNKTWWFTRAYISKTHPNYRPIQEGAYTLDDVLEINKDIIEMRKAEENEKAIKAFTKFTNRCENGTMLEKFKYRAALQRLTGDKYAVYNPRLIEEQHDRLAVERVKGMLFRRGYKVVDNELLMMHWDLSPLNTKP